MRTYSIVILERKYTLIWIRIYTVGNTITVDVAHADVTFWMDIISIITISSVRRVYARRNKVFHFHNRYYQTK